ncbi:amidase [Ramlibacter humi]|uniref:Amidase n=1 Tax=Ramlibacter humi TaxID=2530451 RepID=A0A4Z0BES4_9BURK|nr:amidase [Ramlibacter humi]TFY97181.1 amidase [Ramlibacter humi]
MRLHDLSASLARGETTSLALVQACLARIGRPGGEGSRTFTFVDAEGALESAKAMDALRRAGAEPSPYAGIPISVKDNFDVAGQATRAGSAVLADAVPAAEDAPAVRRLRRAGLIVMGRTNMTEFAFSGIGLNATYGTPRSVWQRDVGRVPGGSSSGAAVSVADGMAHAALATDTGGSARVPAAFNGLVGFKPTASRVPTTGTVPISSTLDSVGYLGRSVECCAIVDAIAADTAPPRRAARQLSQCRFAVPAPLLARGMDGQVRDAFESALLAIARAGAAVETVPLDCLALVAEINAGGGIAAIEAHAWHRGLLEQQESLYDPDVLRKILLGRGRDSAIYLDKLAKRQAFVRLAERELEGYDALLFPTAGIVPPVLRELETDAAAHDAANAEALHNSRLVNLMDGCAVSIPIPSAGGAPVGLTAAGTAGRDGRLLCCAAAIELALNEQPA